MQHQYVLNHTHMSYIIIIIIIIIHG